MPEHAPKPTERYLTPKELVGAFEDVGIMCSYRLALAIMRDCPSSVRGQITFREARSFLQDNEDYRPFAKGFDPKQWAKRFQKPSISSM